MEQATLVSPESLPAGEQPAKELGGKYEWKVATPLPDLLRSSLGERSPMLAHLLYARGYETIDDMDAFFERAPIQHDPFLLPDSRAAVERLLLASDRHETVAIFGDFDCDGLTSTVALEETLRALGLAPIVYVP